VKEFGMGKIGDNVKVKCGNCGNSISECTCQTPKKK
jgi:hypothetical protein